MKKKSKRRTKRRVPTAIEALAPLDPCTAARNFAMQFATLQDAWNSCDRPHWMIWLLNKGRDRRHYGLQGVQGYYGRRDIGGRMLDSTRRRVKAMQLFKSWNILWGSGVVDDRSPVLCSLIRKGFPEPPI